MEDQADQVVIKISKFLQQDASLTHGGWEWRLHARLEALSQAYTLSQRLGQGLQKRGPQGPQGPTLTVQ